MSPRTAQRVVAIIVPLRPEAPGGALKTPQQDLPGATDLARLYVCQYTGSPAAHFLLGVTLARGGEREG